MNSQLPTLMEIFTYEGEELQVSDIELLTEAGSCGEDQLLYHCLNRHGIVTFRDDEVAQMLADGMEVTSHA